MNSSLNEKTASMLKALSPREERIISFAFRVEGGNGNQRTPKEVGQVFVVRRERIRQIEAKCCANCATLRTPISSARFSKVRSDAVPFIQFCIR